MLLRPMSKRLLLMFSFRCFIVSGLTFRSIIHLQFIAVYAVRKWSGFILLHAAVQFPRHHLLKRMSFLHCISLPPFSQINWPYKCGLISGLSILFQLSMCLFLCQYHTVLITTALQYSLKSRIVIPPALFLFPKIAVAIQGLFRFHTNFRIICFSSVKSTTGILTGIAWSLQIILGCMDI